LVYTDGDINEEFELPATFGVVDLFAGPGGLGEGFASLTESGHAPFHIGISVEKETSAHRTLTLRAFLREFKLRHGELPKQFIALHAGLADRIDWRTVDAESWALAEQEARCLELGTSDATEVIDRAITPLRRKFDETILIGGPPCQAYSLAGRARAKGKLGYVPENDERHYLFREYIRVLDRLRPAAFIMENVKGMLSSTIESRLVFEMLMEDLASLGTRRGHQYELRAIRVAEGEARLVQAMQPSDFVVRAEQFGVPQRRHRVIIVGIRADLASAADTAVVDVPRVPRTVFEAIGNLPAIRSGISRKSDDSEAWRGTVISAARRLVASYSRRKDQTLSNAFASVAAGVAGSSLTRSAHALPRDYAKSKDNLLRWLESPELAAIAQHETRGHMSSDLGRYLFASVFGATYGYSPKADDFPSALSPDHLNWHTGVFNDRFRVQLAGEPSTTVTSHISKDGHYYIHPDPLQCRSLTVREAARLQTFPDDYLFLGNRTQQYVQVGNAVPPYLARQIASLLNRALVDSVAPPQRAGAMETYAARNKGK
jgi:DNA (cytosine-5)-methyltransferase 1